MILKTAATCILRSWGGRRLVGVLERIETPFRGSGGWWGVGSRIWGVGAPIETPFTNFNSPVSVRVGQAEEQGPQALEGKVETYDPCFLEVFGPQIRSILRHN